MLSKAFKALHCMYKACGIAAGICIIGIFLLIIAQILARQFNTHIPSSGDIIGYAVVWAAFLGLAYTMHEDSHIRVELFISRLSWEHRRIMNIVIGLLASIILIVLSYYLIMLIYESWQYQDVTDGEIPLPLWLVQLPMGIGSILFTLSMLEFTLRQFIDTQPKETIF